MNILCKGCGKDSGVRAPKGSYSVGEYSKKTGFAWIPGAEDDSFWICRICAFEVEGHLSSITAFTGDVHIYLPTLHSMLKKYLDSLAHESGKR